MVAVLWSNSRLSSVSPTAAVQLLLMSLSVCHLIGLAASKDMDDDYSTSPIKYRLTTPWIRHMTRPHGYLPKQTTPVMGGRSTLKLFHPETTSSIDITTDDTTTLLRHTTSHLDTGSSLTAEPIHPTTPSLVTSSLPQLSTTSPHPEQSTPAPQTQRRSTRAQTTQSDTLPHFTEVHHPTTRHIRHPTTRHIRPNPTEVRPTEEHHHDTGKPPPTEEPVKSQKPTPHPPTTTQSQPTITQAQPITTQSQPITTQSQPMTTQSQPMTTQSQPMTTQSQPMTTQSQPITTQSQPMTTQSQPITTQSQPITTQSQPITTQSQPITTRNPQASSHPATKVIPVPSENPKTPRWTAVPATQIPNTHSPHQDTAVQLILQISWTELCPDVAKLRSSISKFAGVVLNRSSPPDVELLNDTLHCPLKKRLKMKGNPLTVVQVDFCIVSKGRCDSPLTESVGLSMQGDITQLQTYLEPKVLSVHVYKPTQTTAYPNKSDKPQVGIATGLSITTLLAVVIGTVLAYRIYRSRLAKRRTIHNRYYFDGKVLHDTLNESHQLSPLHTISSMPATIHQLMPAVNEGLVMDDEEIESSDMYPSHVLSMHALSQFYSYVEAIVEEYETLVDFQNSALNKSQSSPKHFLSLPGHGHSQAHGHGGNSGSLFHPPPKSRITLEKVSPSNANGFLNANLVKGYGKGGYCYIATAAPWGTSLADFWEMVWEQQSRTLICLCSPEEMGVVCPWYWPREEGIQAAQLYGDILVMRQGCILTENYCMSTLLVKNIQKNLCRPITHFWFTQWPTSDVPASSAVMISFLLQVRQTVQESYGPIVAHCSDGCGRTGTLLAMDSGMRSLEDLCTVDVPSIVCSIRHDRGAAVLLREHYAFIYKVLYEYSVMLTRGLTANIDADISLC
ncbi:uncharacterized protein [Asterias amurensis]|uniref:uncharacterized protein n=1 Tax=Asterias amurensis TaxID=7602 RepID=UPI003AB6B815